MMWRSMNCFLKSSKLFHSLPRFQTNTSQHMGAFLRNCKSLKISTLQTGSRKYQLKGFFAILCGLIHSQMNRHWMIIMNSTTCVSALSSLARSPSVNSYGTTICSVCFEVIRSNKMDSSFTSGIVKTQSLTSSHFSQRLTIVESTGTRGLCVY